MSNGFRDIEMVSHYEILRTFLTQIKKEYKEVVKSTFKRGQPIIKPLMRYREIDVIIEILKSLRPVKCLEWGVGYSTLVFPKYIPREADWFTIEHNRRWAEEFIQINQNPNVKIFHIAPNQYPWTDAYGDGAYSDLTDYIEFPSKLGKFNFILIDGRARSSALIKAHELLEKNGIVILHDAVRKYNMSLITCINFRFYLKIIEKMKAVCGLGVGN